ncbi:MAG: anaerobic ribonucleoside-triphosphate reductase activating protein, partial [Nanoarchaeota archaeon]
MKSAIVLRFTMRIAGFVKTSMVDYPGNIVSTVFLSGCNFRCPYCHNPNLVSSGPSNFSEEEVFGHLKMRIGLIDGVCVSGGEPTINPELVEFLKKIKSLGLLVKLDTNGSNPDMLRKILDEKLVDYIAMDVKAAFDKYSEACGVSIDMGRISKSIAMIKGSNIE